MVSIPGSWDRSMGHTHPEELQGKLWNKPLSFTPTVGNAATASNDFL